MPRKSFEDRDIRSIVRRGFLHRDYEVRRIDLFDGRPLCPRLCGDEDLHDLMIQPIPLVL